MKTAALVPELYCESIEATLEFYRGLGFSVAFQRAEEKFAYLKRGDAEMMFEELGAGRNWLAGPLDHPYGRGVNFQIEVGDADEVFEAAQALSAPVELPLEEKWYRQDDGEAGSRQFVIRDPDGYLLRFYQHLGFRASKGPAVPLR